MPCPGRILTRSAPVLYGANRWSRLLTPSALAESVGGIWLAQHTRQEWLGPRGARSDVPYLLSRADSWGVANGLVLV